ncbi:MAG: L-rhamnose mutarotase, partial [Anaerolineae bacterium]|nr:L-rhamnose mutarotase [Anaerolineae bacterium]MDW8072016.1 L-rhamnose mutarotase [Anaerolineae bacterium]
MERIAFVYRVKPGKKEEYIQAHKALWPSQHEALKRSGVQRMAIFARGDQLFLFAEVNNRAAYLKQSATDPDYQRWAEYMATLLDQPFDEAEPGIFAELEEIWYWTPEF